MSKTSVKQLVEQLGAKIQESLEDTMNDSLTIADITEQIRSAGYEVSVLFNAEIHLRKRLEKRTKKTSDEQFLKAVGIKAS